MSDAQREAFRFKDTNPNKYYYRFNAIGEEQKKGEWSGGEHKLFMQRVLELGVNAKWGIFSRPIPGRIGYQCSNYWRLLIEKGWVQDENYLTEEIKVDENESSKKRKKREHKKLERGEFRKNADIMSGVVNPPKGYLKNFRRFQFTVIEDPSGTFSPGDQHPEAPVKRSSSTTTTDNTNSSTVVATGGSDIQMIEHEQARSASKRRSSHRSVEPKKVVHARKSRHSRGRGMREDEQQDNQTGRKKKHRSQRKQSKSRRRVPEEFKCGITKEVMKDPVIVSPLGHSYEREVIKGWIKTHGSDPISRKAATLKDVIPNRALKGLIGRWRKEQRKRR